MIEVKNLTKRYGNHLAVDHLNFTVESGKIYGFLGPNGAGKSTTMNIMTGYLGATEGQVLIDGHDILKEPEEAKKNIGYLPEIPPLYMEMTVLEYLEFAAELKGIKKDKREPQIEEVIRLAKLRDVENRLIQNLSKGYKQRVGLAQAVLGFPEIIILDEPTVGLDPKQIIEIRELIRKIAMIRVNQKLKKQKMKSRLVLQVHDELLIEAYEPELEAVQKILKEEMEHAAKLKVPLEIDMHTGVNWYEAK